MNNNIRSTVAFALMALFAVSGFAALSQQHVEFGKGPATHLMTKDEQAQWKKINNDADAQAFIDLFWARRDPTPNTPINEFRDAFDARVKYADERFAQARVRGAMTDRGKTLIIMGPPTAISRTGTEPAKTVQTPLGTGGTGARPDGAGDPPSAVQDYSPKQLWLYDQSKVTDIQLGQPKVEIGFVDQYGSNEWKIERTGRTDYVGLFNRLNQATIKNPSLTSAPVYAAAATPTAAPAMAAPMATTTTAAPAAAGIGSFRTDALRTAVEQLRGAKTNPYKNLFVTYGEFITPTGDYYVPVQLYVPKVAGLAADANLTFFGMVEDAAGQPAAIFEEPAKLTATKDDFFYDKTLTLAPGKYRGTFGLAQDGKPVSIVTTDMDLSPLTKEQAGISRLILSNNIYPLTEAQRPTDPYSFGGIKVVPKSDRAFRSSDELWYFFEIRNPGLDPTTNQPKLKTKMELVGTAKDGKKVTMKAPLMDVEAQELKGVPGHFGVGSSIPLTTVKPGEYTLKIRVTDAVGNKNYDLEQPFRVVGE